MWNETVREKQRRIERLHRKLLESGRPIFEYKLNYSWSLIEFKPFCFRWVLAYRLKELYLWLFSLAFIPFLKVADSLQRVSEGEAIDYSTLRRLHHQGFKTIRLR